jgi:hypothetical protein
MRAFVAALGLLLLVPARADAQLTYAPPTAQPPVTPAYGSPAAQSASETSYLLTLCMVQLASQGAPPSQADIDRAANDYFTNGAAVVATPTSGIGGTYFHNGSEVLGVPSSGPVAGYFNNGASTTAYPAPGFGAYGAVPAGPPDAGPPEAPTEQPAAQGAPAEGAEPDAGVPPPPEAQPTARTSGLTCSPSEIEAAMAIAREYAVATEPAAPPPEQMVSPTGEPTSAVPAKVGPPPKVSHPPRSSNRPATGWGIGLAISGALLASASGVLSMRYRLQRRRRR